MDSRLAMVQGQMFTVREAAQRAGLSPSSLYAAMARGELAYVKLGRARRIPEAALQQWLADHLAGGWADSFALEQNAPGGLPRARR